jgi:hypothetical protein
MNKSCIDEIENYLKRSITDIARKCSVCDTDVINVIKKIIGKNED